MRREPRSPWWPLDWLLFSSLWASCVAAALTAAAGLTFAAATANRAPLFWCSGLAFAGTLCVYNVDRLRDVRRDRHNAPGRTRFVLRHRRALAALALAGSALALAAAAQVPKAGLFVCSAVLPLGLLHRRLKEQSVALKIAYVSAAWMAVTVGMPWTALAASGVAVEGELGASVGILVGAPIVANLWATNARRAGGARANAAALAIAGGAAIAGLAAGGTLRPLAAIGACEALALVALVLRGQRGLGERFGLLAVDGALALGGLAAVVAGGA